jgi:hypothetical protein
MVTSVTKVGCDTEIAKELRLLKPTNLTIHWKALEEHFLMVPLVFHFIFCEFYQKTSVLNTFSAKV